MICVRLCIGYAHRMTRKHSTFLIFTIFLLTIITILNLYSKKHSKNYYNPDDLDGIFEYRPGYFLKGIKPNENSTNYCRFNYGLPDRIDWSAIKTDDTPEKGTKSDYYVIYNAIEGVHDFKITDSVTYASHATPEFLYHVIEIAKFWNGPISIAVFVPDYDIVIALRILQQMCLCYEGMSKVSIHFYYPKKIGPVIYNNVEDDIAISDVNMTIDKNVYKNMTGDVRVYYITNVWKKRIDKMMMKLGDKNRSMIDIKFEDCSKILTVFETYRKRHSMMYPINVARNVARNGSLTSYMIVSDIEMVPSVGLAEGFMKMLKKMMGRRKVETGLIFSKTVFIVPLFEVERYVPLPRNKESLVHLVEENRASYFHQKSCSHCQKFPGIQTWLSSRYTHEVTPILVSKREYPYHRWEPLYFGTNHEPWYHEELSWEGRQDKMAQMLELCLQNYRLVVIDGGFLVHAASVQPSRHPLYEKINNKYYSDIIKRLKLKYKDNPKCKVK